MNDKIEEREYIFLLLKHYGGLLTPTQAKLVSCHYEYDLSLSEIAEEEKISKAAVSEGIKSSIAKMEEYENKIGFIKEKQNIKDKLVKISSMKEKDEELKKLIEEL